MKYYILIILNLVFLLSCSSQNDELKKIHDLSEKIKFIDLHEFKYNRISRHERRNPNKSMIDFINISKSLSTQQINKMLSDSNSKIRALAILCLYQTDNHKDILKIADYIRDTTSCYKPNPYPRFGGNILSLDEQPTLEERLEKVSNLKVSDFALALITHYFKQSGHVYFDKEFEFFLDERTNLTNTAGYLKLLKLKATGGISPFQEERIELVQNLKKRIENIENEIDKSIYKLYLSCDEYPLYTDKELRIELKTLGKENIKKILKRQPPTKDPDLLNIDNGELSNWEYNRMCKWILLNADLIFGKNDVDFLIKQEAIDRERSWTWRTTLFFPYWHIAAARIDNEKAKFYISDGLEIFNGEYRDFERGELYAELLHLNGKKEFEFVSNWIFNSYRLNEKNNERIDHFIDCLNQKEDLQFLKYLINNPKFDSYVNVWDIIQIAWQINKLAETELIADNLTREIRHPFGLSRVEWWREKALNKYPNETQEMLEKTKRLINELKTVSNKL